MLKIVHHLQFASTSYQQRPFTADCEFAESTEDVQSSVSPDVFLRNLSLFYLKLHAKDLLPASTIDYIAQQTVSVNDLNREHLSVKIKDYLDTSTNLDPSQIISVLDIVQLWPTY